MSAAVSTSTNRPYGVKRVCAVWGVARSTFYAALIDFEPTRRGPAPAVCDEELHALIVDDLEHSPFTGEGHLHGLGTPEGLGRTRVAQTRAAHHA